MLFEHSYAEVARAMIGRTLVAGHRQAIILAAQGYSRKSNDAPLYRPVLALRPGDVFTPRQRNAILILIACLDGNQHGGCVILRAVEIDGHVVSGPGLVSEALGLRIPKDPGRIEEREDGVLSLQMSRLGPPAPPPLMTRPRNGNGIGEAAITRLMPTIAKRFLRIPEKVRGTFQEFLNELLSGCRDEGEVRRRLRAAP